MKKLFPVTYMRIVAKPVPKRILPHVQIVGKPKYQKKIAQRETLNVVSNTLAAHCNIIVAEDVKVKTRRILFGRSEFLIKKVSLEPT
jgi:hypothetical protein